MRSVIAGMMMLLASASYANDGQIVGKVLVLGTTMYDVVGDSISAEVSVGQVLLDENDANWNEDLDGDSSTFGDDCSVSMYFASDMIDLSTDGGKAAYSALLSAQATGLVVLISYDEDANDNCFVKSVLAFPPGTI